MNLEMCVTGNDCYGSGTRAIPYPSCQVCEAMPPTKRVPKLLSCNWVKYLNFEKSWGSAIKPRACLVSHWKPYSSTLWISEGPLEKCKVVLWVSKADVLIIGKLRCFKEIANIIWGKVNSCWYWYNAHKLRMLSKIHFSEGHINAWYSLPTFF